jgi:hypothetical protein
MRAALAGLLPAWLELADRWNRSDAVVEAVILAWLTSLPNAVTALRLDLAGRGDAPVSEVRPLEQHHHGRRAARPGPLRDGRGRVCGAYAAAAAALVR